METKAKIDSGRKDLRLDEASKLLGWEVDDLIDQAEKGKLTIYVRNGLWDIKSIFYRKNPILVAIEKKLLDKNKLQEFYERYQIEPELNGVNVDVHIDNKWILLEKDTDIGRILYKQNVFGLTPVFPHSFSLFIEQYPFADISIGIGKEFKFPKSTKEFYAEMDPELLVKDAIKDGKLFVMKADIDKLNGLSPDGNIYDLMDHDYWPPELGYAIAAWQHAKDNFKQGDKPSALIKNWLKNYPETKNLSKEAIERITTVANWDKTPGRPKESDTEKP